MTDGQINVGGTIISAALVGLLEFVVSGGSLLWTLAGCATGAAIILGTIWRTNAANRRAAREHRLLLEEYGYVCHHDERGEPWPPSPSATSCP